MSEAYTKHCISVSNDLEVSVSEFKPFEDKSKVKEILEYREKLIQDLNTFDMPESERMFLIRKIEHISEKLLEKARYGK